MGLWWRSIEKFPYENRGFEIEGNPKALPKDFGSAWNLIGRNAWRYQHEWKWFTVQTVRPWYHVYFDDGHACMCYRLRVTTSEFAVRIGQRDTRYLVLSDDGSEPISLRPHEGRFTYPEILDVRDRLSRTKHPKERLTLL